MLMCMSDREASEKGNLGSGQHFADAAYSLGHTMHWTEGAMTLMVNTSYIAQQPDFTRQVH